MQVNFNGISSKFLSVTGLLILLLAIGTNNWRKKVINGALVNEGIWDDCAVEKPGKICYVTKAEGGISVLLYHFEYPL